jgi:hypothetical protein
VPLARHTKKRQADEDRPDGGAAVEKSFEDRALSLVERVLDTGFTGPGPLKSSLSLAQEYEADRKYTSYDTRVRALVNWETSKNFTTGFATGLGGLLTLPATLPAGLGASWLIQARMVGAVAALGGHDIEDDRTRTLALISIAGDAGKEIVKHAGIDLTQRAGKAALQRVPGHVLIDINKRVGFRLLTKGGTTGVFNLARGVPFLGGVVAGSIDAVMLRTVGRAAQRIFAPPVSPLVATV